MAYNQNIPQPTDRLKISQADLLANFQELFTFFGVNHYNFGDQDAGKHKFLQLPIQGVAPATGLTETALYSATGAISCVPEFVFRRANNGIVVPFTEGANVQQGWSRLPSGIVMKWNSAGLTNVQANQNITQTLSLVAAPVLTTALWGIVTIAAPTVNGPDAVAYTTGLASNQIDYRLWRRTIANTQPVNAVNVFGLLLGVE